MFDDVEEIVSEKQSENKMKFYYNREERIANAPKIVQDYYNGKMKPVRGIRIFFALIIFVVASWFYSGMNATRAYGKIDGINFELQAFSYEEQIYASLKVFRTKKNQGKMEKNNEEVVPVKIEADFFAVEANNQVSDTSFNSVIFEKNEEFIRTKFTDFDIIRVDAIVKLNGKEIELSGVVKR